MTHDRAELWFRMTSIGFLGLVALQLVWFAHEIRFGLVPDETWHLELAFDGAQTSIHT